MKTLSQDILEQWNKGDRTMAVTRLMMLPLVDVLEFVIQDNVDFPTLMAVTLHAKAVKDLMQKLDQESQ